MKNKNNKIIYAALDIAFYHEYKQDNTDVVLVEIGSDSHRFELKFDFKHQGYVITNNFDYLDSTSQPIQLGE
jgi:hypothetical protein